MLLISFGFLRLLFVETAAAVVSSSRSLDDNPVVENRTHTHRHYYKPSGHTRIACRSHRRMAACASGRRLLEVRVRPPTSPKTAASGESSFRYGPLATPSAMVPTYTAGQNPVASQRRSAAASAAAAAGAGFLGRALAAHLARERLQLFI